jgi:hypothetical protein
MQPISEREYILRGKGRRAAAAFADSPADFLKRAIVFFLAP